MPLFEGVHLRLWAYNKRLEKLINKFFWVGWLENFVMEQKKILMHNMVWYAHCLWPSVLTEVTTYQNKNVNKSKYELK